MRFFYVLRYFLKEAISNLGSNRLNNLISISIIMFSLFTFGLFLLTAENLTKLVGQWTENVQVNVFMQKHTQRKDSTRLESIIKSSACVANFTYITEAQALRRFQSYYPQMKELTTELDTNPFPPSYEITVRKEFQNRVAVEDLVSRLRADPHVDDVEYDQEWIDRIGFIIGFVRILGLFFGGILMFTATFSISNVIQLMVVSRKDEIEIMRLVGATNSFIKGPFVAEGMLQGLIGGCLGIVGLFGLYHVILAKVQALRAPFFTVNVLDFLSSSMIALVIGGGMLVGFIGSYLSLRRLMRHPVA
jgi:cell division transport system permease protein